MKTLALSMLLVGLSAAPALAQAHAGVYRVAGDEPGRGAFTGEVELRWTGTGYDFTRVVELTTWRHQGRPVSTAWTGRARDVAGGVEVELALDRMGWITAAQGFASRTAADGQPMLVRGLLSSPAAGTLTGRFVGQGAPFVDPTETWTRTAAPGAAPRWARARVFHLAHRPPSRLALQLQFALYASFHRTPWVAPYVARPEFQAGQTYTIVDATDQALLRSRPDLLRVVQQVVDPLALEEAAIKANALGRALRTKAEAADLEIPQRFVDPSGALQNLTGTAPEPDGDGCLWTGVYALTQAMRHGVTGEPAALVSVERTVRALHAHMTITGRPDEFARTLRAAQGAGGKWHAGTGVHAGTEWLESGNNDMFKGLLLGAVAAREALNDPAHAALRADYAASLRGLMQHHPVAKGNYIKAGNAIMIRGAIALLEGTSAARDEYVRKARNPFQLLYVAAAGGGLAWQGQADWSGTHLELTSMLVQQRCATHLSEPLSRWAVDIGLRRSALRHAPTRRALHALAAAAFANLAPAHAAEAVQALRELPFPRAEGYGVDATLRADFCPSPYPNLPWKRDWTTDRGRSRGLLIRPFYEQNLGNYTWKDNPYEVNEARGPSASRHHSTDFLVGYWFARRAGLIGPND